MIADRGPLVDPESPHAYVEGVRILTSSNRRYVLCSVCAKPRHAPRHRAGAEPAPRRTQTAEAWYRRRHPIVGAPPPLAPHPFTPGPDSRPDSRGHRRPLCLVCGHTPHPGPRRPRAQGRANEGWPAAEAAPTPQEPPQAPAEPVAVSEGVHTFRPGPGVLVDSRGRRRPLCATCGKIQNARGRHSDSWGRDSGAAAAVHPVPGPEEARTRAARGAPSSRAAAGVRPRKIPPAEYVAAALAIDAILALPVEAVGFRVRIRAGDLRAVLGVPEYPSLRAADTPPDPEAPPPALIEEHPELAPRPMLEARPNITGLLRGIQSGRHRDLVKRAVEQGWDIAMTGSGHVALSRGQRRLVVSTTVREGRGRGWANLRAEARRVGIDVGGL